MQGTAKTLRYACAVLFVNCFDDEDGDPVVAQVSESGTVRSCSRTRAAAILKRSIPTSRRSGCSATHTKLAWMANVSVTEKRSGVVMGVPVVVCVPGGSVAL